MPASLSWAITTSSLSVYIKLAYNVAKCWTCLRAEALRSKLVMSTLMLAFGPPSRHIEEEVSDMPIAGPYFRPFFSFSQFFTISVSASAAKEVQVTACCTAASLIAHLAIRLWTVRSLLEH